MRGRVGREEVVYGLLVLGYVCVFLLLCICGYERDEGWRGVVLD